MEEEMLTKETEKKPGVSGVSGLPALEVRIGKNLGCLCTQGDDEVTGFREYTIEQGS